MDQFTADQLVERIEDIRSTYYPYPFIGLSFDTAAVLKDAGLIEPTLDPNLHFHGIQGHLLPKMYVVIVAQNCFKSGAIYATKRLAGPWESRTVRDDEFPCGSRDLPVHLPTHVVKMAVDNLPSTKISEIVEEAILRHFQEACRAEAVVREVT